MNFGTLKADIASYLQRDDLTAVIPTFTNYTTSRLNRILRVPQMESRDSRTITAEYANLPADFLEIIGIKDSENRELRYLARPQFSTVVARNARLDVPIFCIEDYQFRFWPTPSVSSPLVVTILYYEELAQLVNDSDENWLLNVYPDAYLYGALMHAGMYLKDAAMTTMARELFEAAVLEASRSKVAATGIASAVGSDLPPLIGTFDILRG